MVRVLFRNPKSIKGHLDQDHPRPTIFAKRGRTPFTRRIDRGDNRYASEARICKVRVQNGKGKMSNPDVWNGSAGRTRLSFEPVVWTRSAMVSLQELHHLKLEVVASAPWPTLEVNQQATSKTLYDIVSNPKYANVCKPKGKKQTNYGTPEKKKKKSVGKSSVHSELPKLSLV